MRVGSQIQGVEEEIQHRVEGVVRREEKDFLAENWIQGVSSWGLHLAVMKLVAIQAVTSEVGNLLDPSKTLVVVFELLKVDSLRQVQVLCQVPAMKSLGKNLNIKQGLFLRQKGQNYELLSPILIRRYKDILYINISLLRCA